MCDSGIHGAYCALCTSTREDANDIRNIRNGFKINRSLEEMKAVCEKNLHLEENRKKNDYGERLGVTNTAITIEPLNGISPLHTSLRSFDWILKLCYHATAGGILKKFLKLNKTICYQHAINEM